MEKYRPLSSFVKEYALLVAFFVGCCGSCGGWIVYDGVVNVRNYVDGTLTIERCDTVGGETRCTGTFRSDDGGLERAGVVVVDVDPQASSVDGWLEDADGLELMTEYGDTGSRYQWGHWGEWWYHVVVGTTICVMSLVFPGWPIIDSWRTQPARRRGRRPLP